MAGFSSTVLFYQFFTASDKLSVTTETLANLTYGATVGAHVIGEVMQHPLIASGMEDSILASIPLVGMGLFALRTVISFRKMLREAQRGEEGLSLRHFESIVMSSLNPSLFIGFYANKSQIMSIGSTAFGMACDYFAFQALVDFIIVFAKFYEAQAEMSAPDPYGHKAAHRQKKYVLAAENLAVSALKLMGWGALAAAHLPACAAVAPVLFGVGSTCLVASALYVGGKATYKTTHKAYYSLFPSDAKSNKDNGNDHPEQPRSVLQA